MTVLNKLRILKDRRDLLLARDKDNGKIVTKLNRKIRKLEKEL